jgi:hypothetical protein
MYLSGQCVFKSSMIRWPSNESPACFVAHDPLQIVDLDPTGSLGAVRLFSFGRVQGVHRVVQVHVRHDTEGDSRHAHPKEKPGAWPGWVLRRAGV